jgi:hypothetical protein
LSERNKAKRVLDVKSSKRVYETRIKTAASSTAKTPNVLAFGYGKVILVLGRGDEERKQNLARLENVFARAGCGCVQVGSY